LQNKNVAQVSLAPTAEKNPEGWREDFSFREKKGLFEEGIIFNDPRGRTLQNKLLPYSLCS
jgi:hypothetical protein